jgi:hypothetical protein
MKMFQFRPSHTAVHDLLAYPFEQQAVELSGCGERLTDARVLVWIAWSMPETAAAQL